MNEMLISFLDLRGTVHLQTVNKVHYADMLTRLLEASCTECLNFVTIGSLKMRTLYNSRLSLSVENFVAMKFAVGLEHFRYLPDLAPNDFWLCKN
jgi:hypothetical protein